MAKDRNKRFKNIIDFSTAYEKAAKKTGHLLIPLVDKKKTLKQSESIRKKTAANNKNEMKKGSSLVLDLTTDEKIPEVPTFEKDSEKGEKKDAIKLFSSSPKADRFLMKPVISNINAKESVKIISLVKSKFQPKTIGFYGLILLGMISIILFARNSSNEYPTKNLNGNEIFPETESVSDPESDSVKIIELENAITNSIVQNSIIGNIREIDGMEIIFIPSGKFIMGSENGDMDEAPVNELFLASYWMDKYEITNDQYVKFLNERGNQIEGKVSWLDLADATKIVNTESQIEVIEGYENHPVVEVSWYGAAAYCEWVGGKLPSEAQWEKGARGNQQGEYPWGEKINAKMANFNSTISATTIVGNYQMGKSPFGLLDMSGNVWEWVADIYHNPRAVITNGSTDNSSKLVRGGSWISSAYEIRVSNRSVNPPGKTTADIGFRCAMSSIDR